VTRGCSPVDVVFPSIVTSVITSLSHDLQSSLESRLVTGIYRPLRRRYYLVLLHLLPINVFALLPIFALRYLGATLHAVFTC